jgi:hypothetical protein
MSLKKFRPLMLLVILAMLVGVTGVSAQAGKVTFFSTQFNIVAETAKINEILTGFDGEVESRTCSIR